MIHGSCFFLFLLGAGKTQFCHGMAVMATLPTNMGGFQGKVLYIDTEGAFSAERLLEIAQNRFPALFSAKQRCTALASSVIVQLVKTSAELMSLLREAENLIIANNVKLIILDSVVRVGFCWLIVLFKQQATTKRLPLCGVNLTISKSRIAKCSWWSSRKC